MSDQKNVPINETALEARLEFLHFFFSYQVPFPLLQFFLSCFKFPSNFFPLRQFFLSSLRFKFPSNFLQQTKLFVVLSESTFLPLFLLLSFFHSSFFFLSSTLPSSFFLPLFLLLSSFFLPSSFYNSINNHISI